MAKLRECLFSWPYWVKISADIDNLGRTERLVLLYSADERMVMRNLKNQMVHEYVEDSAILINALQSGHVFVPMLIAGADRMITEIELRGWT